MPEGVAGQPFAPSALPGHSYRCKQDIGSGDHLHPLSVEPDVQRKLVSPDGKVGLGLLGSGQCLWEEVSHGLQAFYFFPFLLLLN